MNNSTIDRDLEVEDATLNFIMENIPNAGYATIASKLGLRDRFVARNEIVQRKRFYNAPIINACLELIHFVKGIKPEPKSQEA